jgi:hypothetical protein
MKSYAEDCVPALIYVRKIASPRRAQNDLRFLVELVKDEVIGIVCSMSIYDEHPFRSRLQSSLNSGVYFLREIVSCLLIHRVARLENLSGQNYSSYAFKVSHNVNFHKQPSSQVDGTII